MYTLVCKNNMSYGVLHHFAPDSIVNILDTDDCVIEKYRYEDALKIAESISIRDLSPNYVNHFRAVTELLKGRITQVRGNAGNNKGILLDSTNFLGYITGNGTTVFNLYDWLREGSKTVTVCRLIKDTTKGEFKATTITIEYGEKIRNLYRIVLRLHYKGFDGWDRLSFLYNGQRIIGVEEFIGDTGVLDISSEFKLSTEMKAKLKVYGDY